MQNIFKIDLSGHFTNRDALSPLPFQVTLHKEAPEQLSGWLTPDHEPIYYHPPFSPIFLHQTQSITGELDTLFSVSALYRSVHTHASMNFNPQQASACCL